MIVNTCNLTCLFWQEKQVCDDGITTNPSADPQSYCIAGDPDSVAQVYLFLERNLKSYHVRLTFLGRRVEIGDSTFPWYRGDL